MPAPAPASIPLKVETNGRPQQSSVEVRPEPVGNKSSEPHPSLCLGPWETSINGKKPAQDIVKQIADFLYLHVVSRNDLGELSSHGVEIEIEAKLGQFIEQGARVRIPVTTESVISSGNDIRFKSAMTEVCISLFTHLAMKY